MCQPNPFRPPGRAGCIRLECNPIGADGGRKLGRLGQCRLVSDPSGRGRAERDLAAQAKTVNDVQTVGNRIEIENGGDTARIAKSSVRALAASA